MEEHCCKQCSPVEGHSPASHNVPVSEAAADCTADNLEEGTVAVAAIEAAAAAARSTAAEGAAPGCCSTATWCADVKKKKKKKRGSRHKGTFFFVKLPLFVAAGVPTSSHLTGGACVAGMSRTHVGSARQSVTRNPLQHLRGNDLGSVGC